MSGIFKPDGKDIEEKILKEANKGNIPAKLALIMLNQDELNDKIINIHREMRDNMNKVMERLGEIDKEYTALKKLKA